MVTISMCKLNKCKILIHSMAIVKDFMLLSIYKFRLSLKSRIIMIFFVVQPCHEILQHPVNGNVGCPTGNKTNDTCYYSCDIGFELIGDSAQRTCQSNGRWSGRAPSCSPVPCPTLVPPDNGYLQLPCPAVYQSECIVRCFDGYQLVSTNDTISIVNCSLDSTNGTKWSDTEQCKGIGESGMGQIHDNCI